MKTTTEPTPHDNECERIIRKVSDFSKGGDLPRREALVLVQEIERLRNTDG